MPPILSKDSANRRQYILLKSRKYVKLDYKSLDIRQKNCIFAHSCRLISPVIVKRLWADI